MTSAAFEDLQRFLETEKCNPKHNLGRPPPTPPTPVPAPVVRIASKHIAPQQLHIVKMSIPHAMLHLEVSLDRRIYLVHVCQGSPPYVQCVRGMGWG